MVFLDGFLIYDSEILTIPETYGSISSQSNLIMIVLILAVVRTVSQFIVINLMISKIQEYLVISRNKGAIRMKKEHEMQELKYEATLQLVK